MDAGGCIQDNPGVPDLLLEDVLLARVEALRGRSDHRAHAGVARTFLEHGVQPREARTVTDYPRLGTALYRRADSSEERTSVQLAYEAAWRARVSDVSAELWLLDERAFEAAWRIKPRLRSEWPAETQRFGVRHLLLRTFHLPDPDDVTREWAITQRASITPP